MNYISASEIIEIIKNLVDMNGKNIDEFNESSSLVGGNSSLDSMEIVQLCIQLEEKSQEMGFLFDWTSEKAMSNSNSIFKNVNSLASEFNRQASLHK